MHCRLSLRCYSSVQSLSRALERCHWFFRCQREPRLAILCISVPLQHQKQWINHLFFGALANTFPHHDFSHSFFPGLKMTYLSFVRPNQFKSSARAFAASCSGILVCEPLAGWFCLDQAYWMLIYLTINFYSWALPVECCRYRAFVTILENHLKSAMYSELWPDNSISGWVQIDFCSWRRRPRLVLCMIRNPF